MLFALSSAPNNVILFCPHHHTYPHDIAGSDPYNVHFELRKRKGFTILNLLQPIMTPFFSWKSYPKAIK